jgi:NitT/TauT family transport system substrate-binding protein
MKAMSRRSADIRCPVLLLLALGILVGCGRQETRRTPDEITVQLSWTHQAQFSGIYAADQHGFYADEGLAVNLVPRPAPKADTVAPVVDGTADFGLMLGTKLITVRSQGQPVVAIAAIYRRSPMAFITLADSGIARPHDFPGHSIRNLPPEGSGIIFRALMARLGLDPSSVRQIEAGYDMTPFFDGEVDIWAGYVTDAVLAAREKGYRVNVILPEDYGVHSYGDTLFASERLIQENPDLVLRFLRATLHGWRWAVENPEEAGTLVLEYDPTLKKEHELAIMAASVPLIHTGEDRIGWMRPEIWQGTYEMLLEQGVLAGAVDVDEAYTVDFLLEIYGEGQ